VQFGSSETCVFFAARTGLISHIIVKIVPAIGRTKVDSAAATTLRTLSARLRAEEASSASRAIYGVSESPGMTISELTKLSRPFVSHASSLTFWIRVRWMRLGLQFSDLSGVANHSHGLKRTFE
jgi:hypothetical protein